MASPPSRIIASPVSTIPSQEIPRDEVHRIGRSPASNRLYVHSAVARFFASRSRIGFFHALGATIAANPAIGRGARRKDPRSEEHTSELQSLMRITYAVFCLNKKHIIMYNHKQN